MNIFELAYFSGSGTPDHPVFATAVVIAANPGRAISLFVKDYPHKEVQNFAQIGETSQGKERIVSAEM